MVELAGYILFAFVMLRTASQYGFVDEDIKLVAYIIMILSVSITFANVTPLTMWLNNHLRWPFLGTFSVSLYIGQGLPLFLMKRYYSFLSSIGWTYQNIMIIFIVACTLSGIALMGIVVLLKNGLKKSNAATRASILMFGLCAIFISLLISTAECTQTTRLLTITALGEKSAGSVNSAIYFIGLREGKEQKIPEPISGEWTEYNGMYCWFDKDDENHTDNMTYSVTFSVPILLPNSEAIFYGNRGKGIVKIEMDGWSQTIDTYRNSVENEEVIVDLPLPTAAQMARTVLMPVAVFSICFSLLMGAFVCLIRLYGSMEKRNGIHQEHFAQFNKLLKYQFLFTELVKRDFKKKYKRTILGMAWSVLSPLLTLLVMALVFTRFFGRNTPHYIIYLFCGNLVFSYFNESTSQGMTSLMGNASIFTKVNVPKYLFLLSKNVQTLINFGLTMCVFFVFCVIDRIDFTWKFILLLYPIGMLVLFNIGMGLILSALFVFFRDISVFTQLLMYMSAIFYTIDKYPDTVQNLFLLNPVYLFIRYFRKIVIEATVPTVWFHLLMLADVCIALGLGFFMYKKYNTRFLYFV